jgi:hypothetical protein
MTSLQHRRWFEQLTALAVILFGAPGCTRQPTPDPRPPALAGSDTQTESPAQPATEQRLTWDDVTVSFEIVKTDDRGLPETIRVRYANSSPKRGYVELPGPVHGDADAAYRTPSICVETSTPEDRPGGGLVMLLSPPETEQPASAVIAILEPAGSTTVDYNLCNFCLIGHGIGPEPEANFCVCYGPGTLKTEFRVDIITDWGNRGHLVRHLSEPLLIELSEPDLSLHSDFRHRGEPEPQD